METTVTAPNELCYTARCKQLSKMTSRSDINKRFQFQMIILKFSEASERKPKNVKASNLTLLRQNQAYYTALQFQSESESPNIHG
jgi:hypothetical protein